MKKALYLLIIVIGVILSACTNKENKTGTATDSSANKGENKSNYYIDLSTLDTEGEQLICLEGFTVMDSSNRNFANMNTKVGFDKNSFYCIDECVGFKLDFNTGFLGEYCDVPGCVHSWNSASCKYITEKSIDKINTSEGYYEFDYMKGSLYFTKNDGERKEIYKNTYFNEYNEKYDSDNDSNYKNCMGGMIKENMAYLNGTYWVEMLSLDTLETTKPIDFESGIILFDAIEEHMYVVNSNFELIRYNLISGESQKLGDKVFGIMCTKEYVYYAQKNHDLKLYRLASDGTGEPELLIENISAQFYVGDSHIFYLVYGEEGMCAGAYMCDLKGENPQKLDLYLTYEDGTEYIVENQFADTFIFSSCDSINYLFIIDNNGIVGEMNENALFIVSKETGEVIPVSLGIFYQVPRSDDEGHILTY